MNGVCSEEKAEMSIEVQTRKRKKLVELKVPIATQCPCIPHCLVYKAW